MAVVLIVTLIFLLVIWYAYLSSNENEKKNSFNQVSSQINPKITKIIVEQNIATSNDNRTLVTVILLISAFPIGLIVMWAWSKWPLWLKLIISFPFTIGLLFLLGLLGILGSFTKTNTGLHYQKENTFNYRVGQKTEPTIVKNKDISNVKATSYEDRTSISWISSTLTEGGVVEYGTTPASLPLIVKEIGTSTSTYHHADLINLKPSTSFYYRIRTVGKVYDNSGIPFSFKTRLAK